MPAQQRKPRPMPGAKKAIEDATTLIGASLGSVVSQMFRHMEIAEEEIAAVYPRDAQNKPTDPPGLFMACTTPEGFSGKSETLYRHHVREMIARSKTKKPNYSLATEAECLVGILYASHAAPLTHEGMVLAERLFERVMRTTFGKHTPEQWAGQFDEALSVARRKVRTGR